MAPFEFDRDLDRDRLQQAGTLSLPGLTSRTLTTLLGFDGSTLVLVNDFQGNLTRVIKAEYPK